MIKRIQAVFDRKKRAKIRNGYLDLIQRHPNDTRSRLKLGDLYAREGRKKEAVEQYMASAEVFSKAGFHMKSIALYKQVMKLEPASVPALRKAASTSFQYGLYTDAVPYYERLAGILRNDRKNELLLSVYDDIARLPIRETRRRVQLYEALFPPVGASYADPFERLLGIARDMTQEGSSRESSRNDAMALVQWFVQHYPDRVEPQELLVSLLSTSTDQDALAEASARLESMCREKGIPEEKSEVLKKQGEAEEPVLEQGVLRDSPRESGPRSEMQVKVRMEADIYDLLKRKSREDLSQNEDLSGDSGGQDTGKSALDRLEFSDLFETFKESIDGQVSQDDSETHYNLGFAYFEMELYEDAVEEFRLAGKNPALQYDSYFLMGKCFNEMERPNDAIQMYEKALSSSGLSQEQSCAIRYEKALVLCASGRKKEARDLFSEINEVYSNYRDTEQKIKELSEE